MIVSVRVGYFGERVRTETGCLLLGKTLRTEKRWGTIEGLRAGLVCWGKGRRTETSCFA
jgi:hypothetical protein